MPSTTLVCFSCRETKSIINIALCGDTHRKPSDICPKCNTTMRWSNNIPTPKKNDDKAWKKWQETLFAFSRKESQRIHLLNCSRAMKTNKHYK